MMRRIRSLFLALCLALCAAAVLTAQIALADAEGAIRVIDIDVEADGTSYWKANGISVKYVTCSPQRDGESYLQGEDAVDVMVLRSSEDDIAAIAEAGLLADLSESEIIREAVSRMTPAMRDLITTDDGRILAVPYHHGVYPFYWVPEAWEAAGLTPADVPQSYEGLLDFIEAWIARIGEKPEKAVCVSRLFAWYTGTEKYDYMYWLTQMLVTGWELQQRHEGEPVHFDVPQFVALAQRTRELALALYESEPREKKRQSMLELFQSDIRGGAFANGGSDNGLFHTVPMRITDDQSALMLVHSDFYVVREGSEWIPEAIGFLERQLTRRDWRWDCTLYADFDASAYENSNVSEEWLAQFRGYEGEMVYYPVLGGTRKESLMRKFFEGKITAQELASELDELVGYEPQPDANAGAASQFGGVLVF